MGVKTGLFVVFFGTMVVWSGTRSNGGHVRKWGSFLFLEYPGGGRLYTVTTTVKDVGFREYL